MTFKLSKTLIVVLACMAFVSQAMASTIMSYHMMNMKVMNEQSQDMSMMVHSDHNMVAAPDSLEESETTDKSVKDCCDSTCKCFTGGCSMIIALMRNVTDNGLIVNFSFKIFSSSHLALSQQPSSLYRPPILS
ncbi:MAG: hypothetical protein ACJAXS_000658 [Colwellia sp.]